MAATPLAMPGFSRAQRAALSRARSAGSAGAEFDGRSERTLRILELYGHITLEVAVSRDRSRMVFLARATDLAPKPQCVRCGAEIVSGEIYVDDDRLYCSVAHRAQGRAAQGRAA